MKKDKYYYMVLKVQEEYFLNFDDHTAGIAHILFPFHFFQSY